MAQVKWYAGNNGSGIKGTNGKSLAGKNGLLVFISFLKLQTQTFNSNSLFTHESFSTLWKSPVFSYFLQFSC